MLEQIVLAALLAAVPTQEPAPREWNQAHGSAANTSFVDVAPLKAAPAERWRIETQQVLAGPVVAQSKLYVAVMQKGSMKLLAIDPATGSQLGACDAPVDGEVLGLAATDGLAVLVSTEGVIGFRLRGGTLAVDKTISGGFGGEPTIVGGHTLVTKAGGAGLLVIDWASGKTSSIAPKAFGRPGLAAEDRVAGKAARTLAVMAVDEKADKLLAQRFPLTGTMPPKLGPAEILWTGPTFAGPDRTPFTMLIAVPGKEGAAWCLWIDGTRGGGFVRKDGYAPVAFTQAPAALKSRLYGFSKEGRLFQLDASDGSEATIAEKSELRPGAQQGAPSIARDTLYLGNWALEIGTRRVLWCLDKIEADGPAIPAGDELVVIRTKSGALIGLGNDAVAKSGGGEPGPSGGASSGTAARAAAPVSAELAGSKPGIVRSDGLFVAGTATALADGRWRIEPTAGSAQELAADEVALVDDGKAPKRLGDEAPLFRACHGHLERRHAEALAAVAEKYRDAKLPDDARRLLDEAARLGLPAERIAELSASLGKPPPAKGAPARKQCEEAEADAREAAAKALLKAARWCASVNAKTAATVLLARAIASHPAEPPDLLIAEEWIAPDFPRADTPEATVQSWIEWSEALLPSGGTFATPDDSLKRRISITKVGNGALFLQTRNILLITQEHDRALLGTLLQRGEATMRALQKILGQSPDKLPATRLEVRLYRSRQDYLSDFVGGSTPPQWSAGFYSPNDGISRFFSEHFGNKDDPLQHDLQETFAHELTHHYVDRRWVREKLGKDTRSYWMVEGFAEFVASQALEIGRLGDDFDEPTVRPIDMAAAAARNGKLLGLHYLLELDRPRFHSELEGDGFSARLKHTFTDTYMTKRTVFYMQSTALTYFVVNRCKNGRDIYRRWLQQVYQGTPLSEPWKDLGFANVAAMAKAFEEFLASV